MSKATIVSILFGLAVLAVLVYSTLGLRQYSCEVCITYNGEQNCATAFSPDA